MAHLRMEKMDIKVLSRKFMLSITLAILSTWLLVGGKINSSDWGFVVMATVVSYIVSKTLDKKFSGNFKFPVLMDRIKSMFSREFIVSMLSVIGTSWLCHSGYIDSGVWFKIVIAIGSAYNIFNSVEKI